MKVLKSDIYEKDGNIVLEMEAPGYTKDDIDISIDKGTLSISFEKKKKRMKKIRNIFIVKEKVIVKFLEAFYLGDIDEEDIDASFKNGILVVSAPKKKEIETKKTISIKDSE